MSLILPDRSQVLAALEACQNEADIQAFHQTYLGKNGEINLLFKLLKDLSSEDKKTYWSQIKELFDTVEEAFFAKQTTIKRYAWDASLSQEYIDTTTPWFYPSYGSLSLQSKVRRHVEEIFLGMGFHIAYGHDMVTQYENFTSVNIPPTHPATEMHDTFYLKQPDKAGNKLLMRTHTSALQNELIKTYGVPCRCIVPGKVYRYENMDATHDCVFWQIEGIVIDRGISIAHFKQMIQQILSALLEQNVKIRMRPWFFPFVEPWFEIDAYYQMGKKAKRLEILGAWMIHPRVLEEAGVDPKEYSGFAFGMGMSRLVALKYGIRDIRLLTNGDLRFVKSFND